MKEEYYYILKINYNQYPKNMEIRKRGRPRKNYDKLKIEKIKFEMPIKCGLKTYLKILNEEIININELEIHQEYLNYIDKEIKEYDASDFEKINKNIYDYLVGNNLERIAAFEYGVCFPHKK